MEIDIRDLSQNACVQIQRIPYSSDLDIDFSFWSESDMEEKYYLLINGEKVEGIFSNPCSLGVFEKTRMERLTNEHIQRYLETGNLWES